HAIMSRKLNLANEPAWQLFRDYQACPPTATDFQVLDFLSTSEIPQCSYCPVRRIQFHHRDPTIA
ncbi:MAG: radical SAM protein, partial [Pirellulaceae bacterium]